jgi:serine palmitoyltransferase
LNPPSGTDPMAMYGFEEHFEETSLRNALITYLQYALLALLGHVHEILRSLGIERSHSSAEPPQTRSFVPLFNSFESFFSRNIYRRVRDSWNRPVGGVPGARMEVLERVSHDSNWNLELTGRQLPVINMGSYNYLGFCEPTGTCADATLRSISSDGVGVAASAQTLGTNRVVRALERKVAEFLGHEDAVVFQMGFATNQLNIPTLFGPVRSSSSLPCTIRNTYFLDLIGSLLRYSCLK